MYMYIGTLFVCDPRRIYTYSKHAGVREGGSDMSSIIVQ